MPLRRFKNQNMLTEKGDATEGSRKKIHVEEYLFQQEYCHRSTVSGQNKFH